MSRQTILVAEDHLATREGYRELLQHAGLEVTTVGRGDLALSLATGETYAAIILDLDLPGIDGWEVARQLQADPATKDIPIICISGHSREQERASSLRAGCAVFLAKPFAPEELLNWIGRLTKSPANT